MGSFPLIPDVLQQPCQLCLNEQTLLDLFRAVLGDHAVERIQQIADILEDCDVEVLITCKVQSIVIPDSLQIGIRQTDGRS